jgi:hypothetical protein
MRVGPSQRGRTPPQLHSGLSRETDDAVSESVDGVEERLALTKAMSELHSTFSNVAPDPSIGWSSLVYGNSLRYIQISSTLCVYGHSCAAATVSHEHDQDRCICRSCHDRVFVVRLEYQAHGQRK